MKRLIAFLIVPFLFAAASCSGPEKEKSAAEELLARFQSSVADGVIMYGHQDDLFYGHSWKVEDASLDSFTRSDVKDVTGHYPAVLGVELGGLELGFDKNIDGVQFESITKGARAQYERGGVVTVSWHPFNPLTGGNAWDISSDKVVASVLPGGENEALFAEWLERLGDFLATLTTEDGERFPFIFRPWHEHTGSWFWWGRDLCTTEQYVSLWNMTWEYLTKERGMDNIVWCYSPNVGVDAQTYMERWPGDNEVDIMGFDCYTFADSQDTDSINAASAKFSENLKNALEFIKVLGSEHGKLIALSECGFEGLPDPHWWTDALYPAIKDYPLVYVLTWRNAHDRPGHFYAPWKGYEYEEDFINFCKQKQIEVL